MDNKIQQIQCVTDKYPLLRYNEAKDHLIGEIEIYEGDKYEIKISDFDFFPKNYPYVFEIGDRIPKKIERHIYSNTLSCCFGAPVINQILLNTRIKKLVDFIDLIVVPYFQNNSYFEINGEYRYGEYSHNQKGVLEGYFDILEIDDKRKIINLLEKEIIGKRLSLIDKCYCGSEKKLKKCGRHRKNYRKLLRIDKSHLINDLKIIKNL